MPDFDSIFSLFGGTSGGSPALGGVMANSPESLIPQLAAQGVAPPAPMPGGYLGGWPGADLNVGNPTPETGVGTAGAPGTGMADTSSGLGGLTMKAPTGDAFSKALQGVKAPAAPAVQKISTPSVPRPSAMPTATPIAQLLQQFSAQAAKPDFLRLGQIQR